VFCGVFFFNELVSFLFLFFCKMDTVTLSFVFDKILFNYRLTRLKRFVSQITDKNRAISYFFYLYLMLHACVAKFDVTRNPKIFVNFFWN